MSESPPKTAAVPKGRPLFDDDGGWPRRPKPKAPQQDNPFADVPPGGNPFADPPPPPSNPVAERAETRRLARIGRAVEENKRDWVAAQAAKRMRDEEIPPTRAWTYLPAEAIRRASLREAEFGVRGNTAPAEAGKTPGGKPVRRLANLWVEIYHVMGVIAGGVPREDDYLRLMRLERGIVNRTTAMKILKAAKEAVRLVGQVSAEERVAYTDSRLRDIIDDLSQDANDRIDALKLYCKLHGIEAPTRVLLGHVHADRISTVEYNIPEGAEIIDVNEQTHSAGVLAALPPGTLACACDRRADAKPDWKCCPYCGGKYG